MVRSATAHSRSRCRREEHAERVGVAVDVRPEQLGVGAWLTSPVTCVGHVVGVPSTATSATSPRNPPSTAGSEVSQTVT